VALRITEVEAYRYPDDTANHCRMGHTPRNAPMWGPPGHAYVYLCYGMHQMLNLVTNAEGEGAAVLIRACEPVSGLEVIRQRRGGMRAPQKRAPQELEPLKPDVLTGPGKVGAALGIDTSWSGHALYRRGGLSVVEGTPASTVIAGPRIGIGYASQEHQRAPWRLACGDSRWVSARKLLSPA
jgi:DNA-3-methyladenine glycosylase